MLISIGRPEEALSQLDEGVRQSPGDPAMRYLKGRALMAMPRSPRTTLQAAAELEAVLEIDPAYADPEGVTAADIRQVLARMRGGAQSPPPR